MDRNAALGAGFAVAAKSPPTRRRGSKPIRVRHRQSGASRLPRGGVDRNCATPFATAAMACRLPRGGVDRNSSRAASDRVSQVASHAEAWIETTGFDVGVDDRASPPTRRRGSKHLLYYTAQRIGGRLPRGGVDRNRLSPASATSRTCRLPRGGVDRNLRSIAFAVKPASRLPRGGVDRNRKSSPPAT